MTHLLLPDHRFDLPAGLRARDALRVGPNKLHAAILHGSRRRGYRKGEWEDLGVARNVMTTANNGGRDMLAGGWGGALGFGVSASIATARPPRP
jgi:hypothetical protein